MGTCVGAYSAGSFMDRISLLHVAANLGVEPSVALLLEFGAAVNSATSTGRTPLLVAATQGHLDILKILLQHGALTLSRSRNHPLIW